MSSEENAIKRVKNGDAASFEPLVHAYETPLYVFARNMLRLPGHGPELARELVQDTFLAAFANIARFDPRKGKFSTWLFAIARNKCLNARKRMPGAAAVDSDQIQGNENVEQSCEGREFMDLLDCALDSLPRKDKAVFVLAEIQELPLAEVARMEGVPVGTVKSRLSRTKKKLRRLLEAYAR